MCVLVWYAYVWHTHACVQVHVFMHMDLEAKVGHLGPSFTALCLMPWDRAHSLSHKLFLWAKLT